MANVAGKSTSLNRVAGVASAPEPGFVDIARMYLEGAGYDVRRKQMGRSFSGFLKAVVENDHNTLHKVYQTGYQSSKTSGIVKAAMGEETGTAGGYLVPRDYTLRIISVLAENSFLYPRANVIPMTTAEMMAPQIDNETTPSTAGQSPFFGGISFSWGSSQAATETEPKFRQMTLKAWDLLGYAVMSNQFLMDTGPDGEDALVRLFGRAAGWYAEYAFLQGTGTAGLMPLGILNSPCALYVPRGVATTVSTVDIATMASKLLPYSWLNAIWACSPTVMAQLAKIPTFFINSGDRGPNGAAGTLLSRPLFVTEKLPPLGTRGDLIFIDPSLYVIGLRMEVLVDVSPHVSFRNFQTNMRIWLRLDGKCQVSDQITLQDLVTVVSPFVVLQ